MDKFNLKNVCNILSKVIFGSAIVFPLSLSNYNLSHQEGLSLKYSKTAPPLAIFDDEKISPLNEDLEINSKSKKITLETNRLQTRKMAIKVARRFSMLQQSFEQTIVPKAQVRVLAGLSLQKASNSVAIIKKAILAPQNNHLETSISNLKNNGAESREEIQIFAKDLNPHLRDRVEEVANFDEILDEDYSGASFESRANEVLAQAGIDAKAPTDREIANTYGTGFGLRKTYIQRMRDVESRTDAANRISDNFRRSGYTRYTKGKTPLPTIPDSTENLNPEQNEKEDKGTSVASRSTPRQALIAGTLEMTKGLALTGNQKIIVYRQIGGTKTGEGQVFINEGRYEIFVNDPDTGIIVAELLENDNIIGRAEILMPEVMLNAKTPADLKKVQIKLEPTVDRVVSENISEYSYFKKEKLKNSEVIISDAVDANTKVFNSSILVKATKENHWGNIILGSSKQIFTNILSPDATIQALNEILGITTPKTEMGIIRGDVRIAGQKISGAQIEIVGEENQSIKPVYFNSFLPDQTLHETTANGQYAFVDLAPGNYLIRAKYKGKYLSPQLAPVEPGFVTQVLFDVQKPSLAEAFVFDIQSSEMMTANISFLGSEQKAPVKSKKLISFSGRDGVQFLEVEANDQNYYATRITVDKSDKEILIPMISQSWLNNLLARLKVNSIPDTGLIIGTSLELPYSVDLDPGAYNEDTKIVYFDSNGNAVSGAMETPAGGGFVAINVNQGIRSLFNKYHGTKNLKISTMAVDSGAINVFNSKF